MVSPAPMALVPHPADGAAGVSTAAAAASGSCAPTVTGAAARPTSTVAVVVIAASAARNRLVRTILPAPPDRGPGHASALRSVGGSLVRPVAPGSARSPSVSRVTVPDFVGRPRGPVSDLGGHVDETSVVFNELLDEMRGLERQMLDHPGALSDEQSRCETYKWIFSITQVALRLLRVGRRRPAPLRRDRRARQEVGRRQRRRLLPLHPHRPGRAPTGSPGHEATPSTCRSPSTADPTTATTPSASSARSTTGP